MRRDAPDNPGRNAGLKVEQLRQIAVVAIRPDHGTGLHVSKLGVDAQLRGGPAHAAAQDIAYSELLPDFLEIDHDVPVGDRRRPRYHKKSPDARKRDDDVLDHPSPK